MKAFTNQQTGLVNQKINSAKAFLGNSIVDFKDELFENNFKDVVQQGAHLNKGIKNVTFASAFTPLEKTVNSITFSKLKWIGDLVKKRETKVKESLIFDEFLKQNPGLEHTAGVPKGGTFIIIYDKRTKTVVADMSLPYWFTEPPVQEVPEESDTSDDNIVFDWKFNNDIMVYINQNHVFKNQIANLDLKYNQLQFDLSTQMTNLVATQGSIGTLVNTLPSFEFMEGIGIGAGAGGFTFEDPDLVRNGQMMKEIENYRNFIENKKNAGTASKVEEAVYEDLEGVMAAVIENTVEKTAGMSHDIQPGSGEAKVLEMAVNNSKSLKKSGAKNKVKKAVNNAKNLAGERDYFKNNMEMFKF